MGKIISQTSATESNHASVPELKEELYFEAHSDNTNTEETGLIRIGYYDDEIGLWEELESRYRRRTASKRII